MIKSNFFLNIFFKLVLVSEIDADNNPAEEKKYFDKR